MTSEQVYTATSSLADGYHTYTLEWTPDYVSWSFDGAMVRKTEGGQASSLINAATLRFNAWASDSTGWAGALDEAALPAYQFVNWIKYYRYDNGQFVLDWTDDFDSFDSSRWATGNWTFDGNLVDFDPANAVVQDGTLILAITKEGATGFSGTVPVGRRQHQRWRRHHLDAGFRLRLHDRRIAAAWHQRPLRDAACARRRRGPQPPAPVRIASCDCSPSRSRA